MAEVLVVGTGSVGLRHARNLVALGARVRAFRYRARASNHDLPAGVEPVSELEPALDAADAVVVANRTDQHIAVAHAAARRRRPLFIEKPLATSLAGSEELLAAERDGLVVEAGFTLRCHPNLIWLHDFVAGGGLGVLHYMRAHVGQHLAEWRPGTDHRAGYSARRAWGGGVVLDLIHELDLVGWLGGRVTDVVAMTRNVPALDIETEAVAQIGLHLEGGTLAQVHLDYVRPLYGRALEMVGTRGIATWDYAAGTVTLERPREAPEVVHRVPAGFERNTMFIDHMARFLARAAGEPLAAASPLVEAVQALRVALAAHRSASARRAVRPVDIEPAAHQHPSEEQRA